MKNKTFAIYKGTEYSAGIKSDGRIVLRSNDIMDKKRGFQEKKAGKDIIYIKYVTKEELEEIYDKRVIATYREYEFEVMDEEEGKISIVGIVGDYRYFLSLGMKCVDKGVYQKWINKDDAEIKIIKEIL